jgi:hypothetical protein
MAPPEDSLAMAERQVLEGEKYVARQVVPSGFGASCRQVRHWLPEAVSGGGDQVPQRRHALNVDRAPAGERDRLVDVAGRAQEIADLIEGPTEAMGRRELLEPRPSACSVLSPRGDLARYTINSTSITLTDPDAAPRLGREALLALARWMAQGDERSGSSRSTTVDGPSERATGSDPRGAAPDGVAQSPAGTASPGGGR